MQKLSVILLVVLIIFLISSVLLILLISLVLLVLIVVIVVVLIRIHFILLLFIYIKQKLASYCNFLLSCIVCHKKGKLYMILYFGRRGRKMLLIKNGF